MTNKIKMNVPYFQTPNDIYDYGLSIYEIAVYTYLCRCGNHGGTAFPSYNTIAKKLSISRDKAIKTVNLLIQKELISKKHRVKEDGENQSNIYEINNPSSCELLPSSQEIPPSSCELPNKELDYKEININNREFEKIRPVLDYYVIKHRQFTGKGHPLTTNKQGQKVVSTLNDFMGTHFVELEEMKDIIDSYFETEFDCDRNILHFANTSILANRMYELNRA